MVSELRTDYREEVLADVEQGYWDAERGCRKTYKKTGKGVVDSSLGHARTRVPVAGAALVDVIS